MIQLIEGDDAFLRAEAVAAALLPGDDVGVYDGGADLLGAVLDEARTLSFLGGRRVVHVRDAADLVNGGAETLAGVVGEPIALLLEAPKFDRRRKGMKALLKAAKHVQCNTPDRESDLLAFVRRRAKHHGTQFARAADVALVRRLGGHGVSLQVLDGEIAKLAGPGLVDEDRIEQLVGALSAHGSFSLVDAVAAGCVGESLALLSAMFRDGVVKDGKREREPMGLGLMLLGALRWDASKRVREARGGMTPALRDWYAERHAWLREADGATKRGGDPLALLTVLVTRMARARQPRA
jgi:DNA polymerase III delta subunit